PTGRAPGGLPPSSLIRSCSSVPLTSASASSAALRIEVPAAPALPLAESGRMSPALTWPVPMLPPPSGGLDTADVPVKLSPGDIPEQAASDTAASSTANRQASRPSRVPAPCDITRVAPLAAFAPLAFPRQDARIVLQHGNRTFSR